MWWSTVVVLSIQLIDLFSRKVTILQCAYINIKLKKWKTNLNTVTVHYGFETHSSSCLHATRVLWTWSTYPDFSMSTNYSRHGTIKNRFIYISICSDFLLSQLLILTLSAAVYCNSTCWKSEVQKGYYLHPTSLLFSQAEQGKQVWHALSYAVYPPCLFLHDSADSLCLTFAAQTAAAKHPRHDESPCVLCGGASIRLSQPQPGITKPCVQIQKVRKGLFWIEWIGHVKGISGKFLYVFSNILHLARITFIDQVFVHTHFCFQCNYTE